MEFGNAGSNLKVEGGDAPLLPRRGIPARDMSFVERLRALRFKHSKEGPSMSLADQVALSSSMECAMKLGSF